MSQDQTHVPPSVERFVRVEMTRRGMRDIDACKEMLRDEIRRMPSKKKIDADASGFVHFLLSVPDMEGVDLSRDRAPMRDALL